MLFHVSLSFYFFYVFYVFDLSNLFYLLYFFWSFYLVCFLGGPMWPFCSCCLYARVVPFHLFLNIICSMRSMCYISLGSSIVYIPFRHMGPICPMFSFLLCVLCFMFILFALFVPCVRFVLFALFAPCVLTCSTCCFVFRVLFTLFVLLVLCVLFVSSIPSISFLLRVLFALCSLPYYICFVCSISLGFYVCNISSCPMCAICSI